MAVPISKSTAGSGYLFITATSPTTKSAPISAGLSSLILSPVFIPGPTMISSLPQTSITAFLSVRTSAGTTLEIMPPSISETPFISRKVFSFIEYSISVSITFVESLPQQTSSSPFQTPSTIFVFPTSIASIILQLPF